MQPAATVLCQSTAVCRTLTFIGIVRTPCKTRFTKVEQRSWINIEIERGRSTQECFQPLREACGDAELPNALWHDELKRSGKIVNPV